VQLKFTTKDGENFTFKVYERSFSIGRSQDCRVSVPSASFSRRHCLIEEISDQVFITDTGSSNGVFINGSRIHPNIATPFDLRDKITIGDVDLKIQFSEKIPEINLELGTQPNIELAAFKPKTFFNPISARTPKRKQRLMDDEDNREKASLFDPINILVFILILGGVLFYRHKAMKEIHSEASPDQSKVSP
jgi:pSer/pThr/pTyr-binding forkhead associated (FHA) protein